MEATLNEYQPSADYLFLEAQGLLIQDQEDAIAHRRRTGIREGESTAAFVARKRRDRADAASTTVLRQDAADGGRSVAHGRNAGHDEPEEEAPDAEAARKGMLARSHKEPAEDKEPDAAGAYKAMCDRRKNDWKKKIDRKVRDAKKAAEESTQKKNEEQLATTAEQAEEGEDDEPMDAAHERQRMLDRRFGKKS